MAFIANIMLYGMLVLTVGPDLLRALKRGAAPAALTEL
jgi:hypothetical protein